MINIESINTKIEALNRELSSNGKKFNTISYMRLLSIALVIFLCIRFIGEGINFIEGSLIILSILVFSYFVWQHMKLKKIEKRIISLKNVYQRYIDRIDGNWKKFKDIGEEFIDLEHKYSSDLDIFSKGSLFQLINCTNTHEGRRLLSESLLLKGDVKNIKSKQQGVEELSDKLDFVCKLEGLAALNCSSSNNSSDLVKFLDNTDSKKVGRLFKGIVFMLPIVLITLIFLSYLTLNKVFLNATYVVIIINIVLTGYIFLKGYSGFTSVTPFKREFKSYVEIFSLIENEEFKSEYINQIKETLTKNESASGTIKKLEKITSNIDMRYNPVAFLILNIFFLWDFQCMFSLEDFKSKYGCDIKDYINAVGKFEEAISLSTIKNVCKITTVPSIIEDRVCVQGEDVGHPLIDNNIRVTNNAHIDGKILVITGSNMSGKTTYLRTLGINLILAYTGARVVASKFKCSHMDVVTSMRISDNLEMGISTFYAELLKIKKIIDASKENKPMIFLIDEIFRGTNSQDRIVGAINVVNNLSKPNIIGGISTHDFELCDIDNKKIANYHFEEHYKEGKILFDYKIKEGISTTKNARFLMRMVGIDIKE
ncbi:MutS-related protein [Clostridium sp.]|uniref:MutS-related protein n=1 Tax=Clostridium sp. TaxID=1506 RepID=UPI002FCC5ADC